MDEWAFEERVFGSLFEEKIFGNATKVPRLYKKMNIYKGEQLSLLI